MPLIPKTPAEWTRSFAFPLFVACIYVIAILVLGPFYGGNEWRYWGWPVAFKGLPLLGIALGVTCIVGTGLPRGFRIAALIVAALSTFCGWMLAPGV